MKDKICTNCGHIGKPISQGIGSFAVDAVIWFICISVSIFSSIFALMIVPVLWTIYHLALYKTTTCPKCENIAMVSQNSKKAQEYLAEVSSVTTAYKRTDSK